MTYAATIDAFGIGILLLGADSVILEGRDKQLLAAPK